MLGLVKAVTGNRWFHPLLLFVWVFVGVGLRFNRLASKTPWTDEFATLVFSLGNSFHSVPLDQAIAPDVLLQPLQPDPSAGIGAVIHHLLTESNHPPVYFVLAHLWMSLFPTEGGLVSLWAARSLPAVLGVASIPAMFGLGSLAFRSQLVGQMAAAMMAVSPFGVFLAQEARHYTLATLFVIASLACLIIATRAIHQRTPLPIGVGLMWVGINTLGVATHYFFTLTLCAEAIVLMAQGVQQRWWEKRTWLQSQWRRLYMVAVGTLTGGLVWLPLWQSNYGSDNKLTSWIYDGDPLANWLEPIGRILAWMPTMLVALPMEITTLPLVIVIASGLMTGIFLVWVLPILSQGFKFQNSQLDTRLSVQVFCAFIIGALVLFFGLTYGIGADLTLAPRYLFVYFPGAIALLGATLAAYWDTFIPTASIQSQPTKGRSSIVRLFKIDGKKAVTLIWLMGFLGSLTVTWNLGYLQSLRSDLLVNVIQNVSNSPVLIATTHQHHGQTGRMMGLAWEFKRLDKQEGETTNLVTSPQFLLAHNERGSNMHRNPTTTLQETVAKLPRPLDIWLVNFHGIVNLNQQNCFPVSQSLPKLDSYWYRLYRCPAPK